MTIMRLPLYFTKDTIKTIYLLKFSLYRPAKITQDNYHNTEDEWVHSQGKKLCYFHFCLPSSMWEGGGVVNSYQKKFTPLEANSFLKELIPF